MNRSATRAGTSKKNPLDTILEMMEKPKKHQELNVQAVEELAAPDGQRRKYKGKVPNAFGKQQGDSNHEEEEEEEDEEDDPDLEAMDKKDEEDDEKLRESLQDKQAMNRVRQVLSQRVMHAHQEAMKQTVPDKLDMTQGFKQVQPQQIAATAQLFTSSAVISRIWSVLCNSMLQGGVVFSGPKKDDRRRVHENRVWSKFIRELIRSFMCWGIAGVTWEPTNDANVGVPIVIDLTMVDLFVKRTIYGNARYVAYPKNDGIFDSVLDPNAPLRNIRFFEGHAPPDANGHLRSRMVTASTELDMYDTVTRKALQAYARQANPPMVVRRDLRRPGLEDLTMGLPGRGTAYEQGAIRGKVMDSNRAALNKATANKRNNETLGVQMDTSVLQGSSEPTAGFVTPVASLGDSLAANPYGKSTRTAVYQPTVTQRIDLMPGEHLDTIQQPLAPTELSQIRQDSTRNIALLWGIPPSFIDGSGGGQNTNSLHINQRQVFDSALLQLRSLVASVVNPVYQWIHTVPDALNLVLEADGSSDLQVQAESTIELSAPPPSSELMGLYERGFLEYSAFTKLMAAQTNTSLAHWRKKDPLTPQERAGVKEQKEESKSDTPKPKKTQTDASKVKSAKRKKPRPRPEARRKKNC